MKPEEAQERTEKRWLRTIHGEEPMECGWCMFANDLGPPLGIGRYCDNCPVKAVFGVRCGQLQAYNDWCYSVDPEERTSLAQTIYDLLIAHRQQLIAVGEEILREQTIRN